MRDGECSLSNGPPNAPSLQQGPVRGHEDAFPRPRLNLRCRFSRGTFAGMLGNGRDAPKASVPVCFPRTEIQPE